MFKEKHKEFAIQFSISESLPFGKIHLERRNWFKAQEDVSKALNESKTLGIDPDIVLDLCFLSYYSKDSSGFERYEIKRDLLNLRKAAKILRSASGVLKTDPAGSFRLTSWTTYRLEDELLKLKCVQNQLQQIETGIEMFCKSVKFPKHRPYHWEDINRAVDLSSPNPRQYLQFESLRAQRLILRLAALFRSALKSKSPQDRLTLVFVTKIMNFRTKTNVHIDLEGFSKMRRTLEKRKGALLSPEWIENFKKSYKLNPK